MQVLVNRINNATKFTQNDRNTLNDVYSGTEKKIYLKVTDTGCGIPRDKHQEVFGRFTKLDSYSQGTGLGLAISKEIAVRMGGDLYIDEDYTQGTRFIFVIPYS